MNYENAIMVVNKTRLEQLIYRFNTKAQARFYIEHAGGDFSEYEREHNMFKKSLDAVHGKLSKLLNVKIVERQFLPNFIFSEKDMIVVLGQDGLVANTAKYGKGIPMIAINPDKDRYDGILLPFIPQNFEIGIYGLLEGKAKTKQVTMAEVKLNDGQRLLAFNDFFIGPATHVSARYKLTHKAVSENQSSSGIIVSTGAGSTGWLSSLFNMANGIIKTFDHSKTDNVDFQLDWNTRKLVFIVREPFKSINTEVNLTAGMISENNKLIVESFMPVHGKIFSDGIENDYLNFNSGTIAEIGIAKEYANIVLSK